MNDKQTFLILARHGETEWNAAEIFRGRADVPLNDKGLKQAQLLGDYLRDLEINAVYSSPLKRAIKTAAAIAAFHSLEIKIDPSLTDIDYGKWQGLTAVEVAQKYRQKYHIWLKKPEKAVIPGGESLDEVQKRVVSFLKNIIIKNSGGIIVMVSHRVVLKAAICSLLGAGNLLFPRIKVDNAGITRFEFDANKPVLTCLNDTSFLKPLNSRALADF